MPFSVQIAVFSMIYPLSPLRAESILTHFVRRINSEHKLTQGGLLPTDFGREDDSVALLPHKDV